jgi:alpha-ribazole phosphatase
MTDTLWIARHAPVAIAGICYGRADVPVLRASADAAALLASTFPAASLPEVVWSSVTARCRTVATDLAQGWSAEIRADALLCELDFGRWEGRAWSEIESSDRDEFERWMRDWRVVAPPGGESPRDLERRARRWLDALDLRGTHALVAHAGFVRALRVILDGVDWDEAMRSEVPHLCWLPVSLRSWRERGA